MGSAAIDIADVVVLELEPVDDPGGLGLGLLRCPIVRAFALLGRRLSLFRRWIAKNQNPLLAVGCPFELFHILNRVYQALRLAALVIEQIDLCLLFVAL